jgi:hypothetical protein
MTGMEASDESHGTAWKTRFNGDPMPYEAALLSNQVPGRKQMAGLEDIVRRRQITTA